jgi:hypothetical protein
LKLMPRPRAMMSAFSASSSGIRTVVVRLAMPSWHHDVTPSYTP